MKEPNCDIFNSIFIGKRWQQGHEMNGAVVNYEQKCRK